MPKRTREEEAAASPAPMSALAARRLKQQKQAEAPPPSAPPKTPSKTAPKTIKTPERPSSSSSGGEELMSARARLEALAARGGPTTPKTPYEETEPETPSIPVPIVSRKDIRVSNFQRDSKNFVESGDGADYTVTATLQAGETLVVQGEYRVEVLKGYVSLYGAIIEPGTVHTVYAPTTHSLPVIEYCSKSPNQKKTHNEDVHIKLTSFSSGLRNIKNISPNFRHIWTAQGARPERSFSVIFESANPPEILNIPSAWAPYLRGLKSAGKERPPVIVVAGGKSSGKSTLTRILANTFLSLGRYESVAYMDVDPGQPEFSPSTVLSLQNLREPVLGPSYTHCSPGLNPTVLALNYGFTSPREEPSLYLNIARTLFEKYTELVSSGFSMPLIINTAGWTKGLGLELLQELLTFASPTDFLFLDPHALPHLSFPAQTKPTLLPSASASATAQKYSAAALRHLQISTHLHQLSKNKWEFTPLTHLAPTIFPYPSTAMIELMSETLPASEYPTAIIGTVVALLLPPSEFPDSDAAPYLLTPGPHIPTAPCLGLGVVRAVDVEKRELQILVGGGGAEMLRKWAVERVLVCRGRAEMPVQELTAGVPSGWTQGSGAGVWRVRRNLMRKGMVLK